VSFVNETIATLAKLEERTMVNCPLCDAALDLEEDELDEGDEFACEECGAELNVTGTHPLELGTVKDVDEEDEDEDEDLDEDEAEEDADEEEEDDEDEDKDEWK
jgi:lysine biosynthesis protein LysW